MVKVKPFRALRPKTEFISTVNSPPYDVISRNEAIEIIKRNPDSFLKVIKPEATVCTGKMLDAFELANRAADNLKDLINRNIMVVEPEQSLYIYQQSSGDVQRIGIVACLSVDDYKKGFIKQHEKIRIETWRERIQHIRITRAHTGCALMIYKANSYLEHMIRQQMTDKKVIYDFISHDGIRNRCWLIKQRMMIHSLLDAFKKIEILYIADGHHRVAAAIEVAKIEKKRKGMNNYTDNDDHEYAYFPAVLVPHHQMMVLGYHRLIKGLQKFSPDKFLSQLGKFFKVERLTTNQPFLPSQKGEFGMNLVGQWYKIFVNDEIYKNRQDIVDQLDVSILQNLVLNPLLGIKNPQKNKKMEFIGGNDALARLEKEINSGTSIAFSLFPTSIEEVMAVSDQQQFMPPKSTWFEPKIRSGVFVHLF